MTKSTLRGSGVGLEFEFEAAVKSDPQPHPLRFPPVAPPGSLHFGRRPGHHARGRADAVVAAVGRLTAGAIRADLPADPAVRLPRRGALHFGRCALTVCRTDQCLGTVRLQDLVGGGGRTEGELGSLVPPAPGKSTGVKEDEWQVLDVA